MFCTSLLKFIFFFFRKKVNNKIYTPDRDTNLKVLVASEKKVTLLHQCRKKTLYYSIDQENNTSFAEKNILNNLLYRYFHFDRCEIFR